MRRISLGSTCLLAAVCWAGAVFASDVVEFSDGRYLEVRSHSVEGDVVRLDVGRDSFMVIPAESIDTIRRDRVIVYPRDHRPGEPVRRAEARDVAVGATAGG